MRCGCNTDFASLCMPIVIYMGVMNLLQVLFTLEIIISMESEVNLFLPIRSIVYACIYSNGLLQHAVTVVHLHIQYVL